METYFYFRTQATIADDDDIAQSAMFPVSSFMGCYPTADTTLKVHFKSLIIQNVAATRVIQNDTDLASASIMVKQPHDLLTDHVLLTITANKHREVMEAIANATINRNSSRPFVVVADDLSTATEYLHANITACGAITINTAAAGSDSFSSTFS
tara:strand:- start:176 stop:637 length:462 start_codon:yes stop_codon:yes gene_type:complete